MEHCSRRTGLSIAVVVAVCAFVAGRVAVGVACMKFNVEFKNRDGSVRIERIEVEGRRTIDFMASNAQGVLQVCKFVHDQAGEHRGMAVGLLGSAIQFNYADGRVVAVRDATGDGEYRLLPRVVLPFQMKVPAGILRKAGTDTIMLPARRSRERVTDGARPTRASAGAAGTRGSAEPRALVDLHRLVPSAGREDYLRRQEPRGPSLGAR